MKALELILAVAAMACGLAVIAYTRAGMPERAAIAGGAGLVLCNADLILRQAG